MKKLLALLLAFSITHTHAGLESGTYVNDLVITNPVSASDPVSQGADHLRLVKTVLKNTFPGLAGAYSRVQSKSGNYTGVANDNTTLVVFTATATFTLPSAVTVGNQWMVFVYTSGGTTTISPAGGQTINGTSSQTQNTSSSGIIFSDGANFQYIAIQSTEPAGIIKAYAGTAAPTGYLSCDGSAVSRTTYAALFAAIGTTWGVGDGSTTFNLPDLRRRVLAGSGGSGTGTLGNAVGNTGGEETHTLTSAEMPSHTHTASVTDPGHVHNRDASGFSETVLINSAGGGFFGAGSLTTGIFSVTGSATTGISVSNSNTGGGGAHNVRDPSAVVLYVIKF